MLERLVKEITQRCPEWSRENERCPEQPDPRHICPVVERGRNCQARSEH
jgi:hypothetical protein